MIKAVRPERRSGHLRSWRRVPRSWASLDPWSQPHLDLAFLESEEDSGCSWFGVFGVGSKLGRWAGKNELDGLDAWSCSESFLDLLALARREDVVVKARGVRVRRLAVKKKWWDERWEDPPLRESGILVAMVRWWCE